MKTAKEIYQYALGAILILGSFAIVALIATREIPSGSKDAVMLCLGALVGGGAASVWNYFFGSSKGSADKNEIIGRPSSGDQKENA